MEVLDANLEDIRAAAKRVQEQVQQKRVDIQPEAGQLSYQVGDLVLYGPEYNSFKPSKLSPRFLGPYVVKSIYKADYTIEHVVLKELITVHMERLKPFFGSKKEAFKVALRDKDQFVIERIVSYKGDPSRRSSVSFLVKFIDGDERWLPFGTDIATSGPFEDFCLNTSELRPLLVSLKEWKVEAASLNRIGITTVSPGDKCFVDLRAWGHGYYDALPMEDKYAGVRYVVECRYTQWSYKGRHDRIDLHCPLFKLKFIWSAVDVMLYGMHMELAQGFILVDEELCRRFKEIL